MSADADRLSVAIVGGGIGGLTAAIGLIRAGVDVQLYEQAPEISEVGAGIGLFPNSTRILFGYGLEEPLRRRGFAPPSLEYLRWEDGSSLARADFLEIGARFGYPHLTLHRAHLVDILLAKIPADVVHLNHRLIELDDDGERVRLGFDGGESAEADLVIGADGIRSAVARLAGLASGAEYAGYAAYRTLVRADRLPRFDLSRVTRVWLGPENHFACYWVGDGSLLNMIGYVSHPPVSDQPWTLPGTPEDVVEHFAGWDPEVLEIIGAAGGVTLYGMFDRLAASRWDSGRVVVLGDAAHPILSSYAQGAGLAIEDAATLSELLGDADVSAVSERLRLYSDLRGERARRLQTIARVSARQSALPDGPEQVERDRAFAEGNPFASSDWIYGHDTVRRAREALVVSPP